MAIVEAVLFASEEPLPLKKLREVLDHPDAKELKEVVAALQERYSSGERGLEIVEVAGGWQFRTRPEHAEWVRRLRASRPARLTRPGLETLAIIAYRQPITRPEIEEIRRVDSGAVVHTLLERGLVRIVGRKDVPGRPVIYGTTKFFLEAFGLKDLAQLPPLREIEDLGAEPADALAWTQTEEEAVEAEPARAAEEGGESPSTAGTRVEAPGSPAETDAGGGAEADGPPVPGAHSNAVSADGPRDGEDADR